MLPRFSPKPGLAPEDAHAVVLRSHFVHLKRRRSVLSSNTPRHDPGENHEHHHTIAKELSSDEKDVTIALKPD